MNRLQMIVRGGLLLAVLSAGFAQDSDIATSVEGSNVIRFDNGKEVDTRLADRNFPDNLVARRFVENRFRMDVYRGNVRVGGRFLYFRPSEEDSYRDGIFDENRVDKRYFELTYDPLRVRAGHFSDVWAYGLALSMFENRDLYFDTELDGAHVELSSDPIFVTVLRGSAQEGRLVHEAELSAARINARAFGQSLGFSYVFMDSGAYSENHVAGVDWRVAYGALTLYGERAWSETFLVNKSVEGHATYFGTVVSKWGWSVLLEYKDYDYKNVTPFQNPATAFREIGPRLLQSREPHVLNIPNEVGLQAEVSGQATSSTFLTYHYSISSRHPTGHVVPGHVADTNNKGPVPDLIPWPSLKQVRAPYWEAFVSAEQDLPAARSMFLELGANEEASTVWQKRKWAWLRFATPVRNGQELELESETLLITDMTGRSKDEFTDQLFGIGWDNGKGLSLALQQQFSTDERLKNREGSNWPSAELATTLGNGRHRLSLFYGQERGGLRCSNGVCRQVQPFSGFRLTLESTF